MTTKTIFRKITSLILLGMTSFMPMVTATPVASNLDLRSRAEYTESGEKNEVKTTLSGVHESSELVKAYTHEGDFGDYTSFGGNINRVTIFANEGDKEGAGLEVNQTFVNTTLGVGVQHAGKNEDKTLIGGTVEQKVGSLTIGTAYDSIENKAKDESRTFPLVNVIYDFKNDAFGAAYTKGNQTADNSALAFHCHYGKDEKFGDRTFVKYDWNTTNNTSTITLDTILAQNPTFGPASYPWFVSRDSMDAGMYARDQIENPFAPERVPLAMRTRSGFVGELKVCATENEGYTGFARADLGYKFKMPAIPLIPSSATLIGIGQYDLSGNGNNKIGASALVQKGNLCFEVTATRNLSEKAKTQEDLYASLSYVRQFGSGGQKQ